MSRKLQQRGVALVLALFGLILLSAIAFALIQMANTETSINGNFRESERAYFAAMAGLQSARQRLMPQNTPPHAVTPPSVMPSTTGGIIYITNPAGSSDVVDPSNASNPYFDRELCHENFAGLALANPGTGHRCTSGPPTTSFTTVSSDDPYAGTTGALNYKWVRITLKANASAAPNYVNGSSSSTTASTQVCWDGQEETLPPTGQTTCSGLLMPVFVLTSLAVTPLGVERMLQMDTAQDPAPSFPAAFTIAGNGQTQCQIQGQGSVMISGVDHAPGAPAGSGTAGLALNDTNDYNQCKSGVSGQSAPLIQGAAPYNTSPSVRNTSTSGPPLDPRLDPAQGLMTFVNSLIQQADQTFSGNIPTGANLGTCNPSASPPVNSPRITYVSSPTQIGAISGCGILIVESSQAQLQIDGNIQWNGIIMLIATGTQAQFQMQSGSGSINGAFYMAAANGGQLQMQMQQGPSGGINYDSRWVNNSFPGLMRIIAFRDLDQ